MSGIHQMFLGGSETDPDFSSVVLLLDGQGTNGGTSFPDLSNYAHATARTGATTSTAQKKWGSSSVLNSAAGSTNYSVQTNVGAPLPSEFIFGTDELTVEIWFYLTALNVGQILMQANGGTGVYPWQLLVNSSNKVEFRGFNASSSLIFDLLSTTTVGTGAWYFVQGRRRNAGGNANFELAVGGSQEASTTAALSSSLYDANSDILVGNYGPSSGYTFPLIGYWQDARVTKGVARAFALPTGPFPHS